MQGVELWKEVWLLTCCITTFLVLVYILTRDTVEGFAELIITFIKLLLLVTACVSAIGVITT